ncbi:MAG TPA: ATP-binding protein [Thermoleophilaceae bacterium]|jgi:anti-sigma regulatory factor (Ser/Thr protein kinase)
MGVVAASAVPRIDQMLRLDATPASLRVARDAAEQAASACGLGDAESYDFKLAATEAVANAIEHGRPCADGCIGMRVHEEGPGYLTLCVSDCGNFVPPRIEPADLPERGRGIAVISVLMDEVELLPGDNGTIMRMRKRLAA